jgi:RHS repeat-associated protein
MTVLISSYNPNGDADSDGVPNMMEIAMGTNPNNSTSYIPIAVPYPAEIDNSIDDTVYYDYTKFYSAEYPHADSVMAIFPAGSLTKNNIPLIIQVKNSPSDGLVIKDSTTNAQLGRYFDFGSYNSIVSGKSVTMQFPVVEHIGQSNVYAVQSSGTSPVSYDSISSTKDSNSTNITTTLTNTHAVTLAQKQSVIGEQAVYFDDGTVYSSKKSKSVFIYDFNMATSFAEGTSNYYESGNMEINYDDYSSTPSVNKTITADLSFQRIHKILIIDGVTFYFGYLLTEGSIQSSGKMRINSVTVNLDATSSLAAKTVTLNSLSYQVYPGRTLTMTMSPIFNNGTFTITMENSTSFSFTPGDLIFESADMGGEGRILMDANYALNQVYYTYQYYLKDHLGSTRMVIDNNGAIPEAVMYQPYGTMSNPLNISTPEMKERKKFTGKEYDEEGAVSGVTDGLKLNYFGARFYDPEIGVWTICDRAGQFWNPYSYGNDPINFIDPYGLWSLGLGIVFGYTKNHGWHIGFGAACDFQDEIGIGANASYVFNDDGSQSGTLGAGVNLDI